jgi:hypothetical protein
MEEGKAKVVFKGDDKRLDCKGYDQIGDSIWVPTPGKPILKRN